MSSSKCFTKAFKSPGSSLREAVLELWWFSSVRTSRCCGVLPVPCGRRGSRSSALVPGARPGLWWRRLLAPRRFSPAAFSRAWRWAALQRAVRGALGRGGGSSGCAGRFPCPCPAALSRWPGGAFVPSVGLGAAGACTSGTGPPWQGAFSCSFSP